jgi:hypothetical protein
MSQLSYRVALIFDGVIPVNSVVLADGVDGDKTLASNPSWVEVTGMNPMPGVDAGWSYVKGKWVAPVVPEPTVADVEARRGVAYRETADPLYFQYQRGEVTEQVWLDAVAAVKTAHPYPEA